MKNVTLSADEELITRAREKAQREHTTLNAEFRRWLELYVSSGQRSAEYAELMRALEYVHADRRFSRDELNER